MSCAERGGLLHEGAGSAVMSAYVEVIFDNADQRFPTDTPEVILRRTIGQKKDEYSLNRKNTTRQGDEHAEDGGGRITAITNMPDAGRLDILKEVAGKKVYEERRAASQMIMKDAKHRRTKIDELLDNIRGRLGELEEEKEELREFQEKDRARRCWSTRFTMRTRKHCKKLWRSSSGVEQTDDDREALQCGELELEKIDAEISELHSQIKLLSEERAQLEDERRDTAKQKAKTELDYRPPSTTKSPLKKPTPSMPMICTPCKSKSLNVKPSSLSFCQSTRLRRSKIVLFANRSRTPRIGLNLFWN
ncbi:Structural maintenance of chromosomes protein 3 [Elasticomyces elasticus]|nr:Structural maintenance of chromosomes protein 3 [Elasticomyces elasticus]